MFLSTRAHRCFAVVAIAFASFGVTACGGDSDSTPDDEQNLTETGARFETFKGIDGKYYFHMLAANGELVLRSQAYTTLASAKKGIDSVLSNGVDATNYDVLEAQDGQYYFNVVAANNKIVGTSELYVSKSNAERAVDTLVNLVSLANRASAAAKGGARFEVFAGADGKQYFHMRAANGEIVLASEGYTTKTKALAGITSVRTNGADAENFEVLAASNGQYYINLVATNGQIIATGELYVTKTNATRAVTTISDLLHSQKVADPQ
jgi:uncharacterized protein